MREYQFVGEYRNLPIETHKTLNAYVDRQFEEVEKEYADTAKQFEVTPSIEVKTGELFITTSLMKQWDKYNSDKRWPSPKIFYIPELSWESFQKTKAELGQESFGKEDIDASGAYDSWINHVYIRLPTNADPEYIFTVLAHELAHAYRKTVFVATPQSYEGQAMPVPYAEFNGAYIETDKFESGSFLEEFYATEMQIRLGLETIERIGFGRKYVELVEMIKRDLVGHTFTKVGTITEQDLPYLDIININEYPNLRISKTGYGALHRLGSEIISSIPDGWNLFEQARLLGKWGDFARAVNAKYGSNTFRYLMRTDKDKDSVVLLSAYLESTGVKQEILGNVINSRQVTISQYGVFS